MRECCFPWCMSCTAVELLEEKGSVIVRTRTLVPWYSTVRTRAPVYVVVCSSGGSRSRRVARLLAGRRHCGRVILCASVPVSAAYLLLSACQPTAWRDAILTQALDCPSSAGTKCTYKNSAKVDEWIGIAVTGAGTSGLSGLTCSIDAAPVCSWAVNTSASDLDTAAGSASSCGFILPAGATMDCAADGTAPKVGRSMCCSAHSVGVPLRNGSIALHCTGIRVRRWP